MVLSRLEVTQTTKQQYEKDYPEEYKEQNEPFLKEEILSEIKSTNTSALKEGKTKKYYKGKIIIYFWKWEKDLKKRLDEMYFFLQAKIMILNTKQSG